MNNQQQFNQQSVQQPTTPSAQPPKSPKSKKPIFLIVVIFILIIGIGILAWQLFVGSGQETFASEEYGFEIQYPKSWTIEEETKETKYRLDIYHPKNLAEADTYGNIAIEVFVRSDNKEFFEKQIDLLKNKIEVGIFEEISANGINGYKRTELYQEGEGEAMVITELFPDKGFRILVWSIDSANKKYKKKTEEILSTFKFLD